MFYYTLTERSRGKWSTQLVEFYYSVNLGKKVHYICNKSNSRRRSSYVFSLHSTRGRTMVNCLGFFTLEDSSCQVLVTCGLRSEV
jgi:hypothetical protein